MPGGEGEGGGGDDLDYYNTDAGGSRKTEPRKRAAAPAAPAAAPAVDPMAAFMEMMAGFAPPHAPSGPTDEEIEADRISGGLNDLDEAFGNYMLASENATEYVNTQIDTERANAALMGVAYNITDEAKTERISNYFSEIFSSKDWEDLQGLNTDFGAHREGDPLEFLVTRGVDVTDEAAAEGDEKTGFGPKGRAGGGKFKDIMQSAFTSTPNQDESLGTASLTTGG